MIQTQTTQTIQTSQSNPAIKLSTWSEMLWNGSGNWYRSTGYAVNCSCGHGDLHLVLSEPRKSIQCIQRDHVIVLQYLPSE